MVVTWWNKISEIGQQHCTTRQDQKVVRMLNRVSFILAVMMIVFAFSVGFFFYHRQYPSKCVSSSGYGLILSPKIIIN